MNRFRRAHLVIPPLRFVMAVVAVLAGLSISTVAVALSQGSEEAVRRLLTQLAAVGEEYREGVKDGGVVRPVELDEAKSFLDDAQRRFQDVAVGLPVGDRDISVLFHDIDAAIDARASADAVAAQLATLRQRIVTATGVAEQIYPPAPPSAVRGQQLFAQNCVSCHGEHGDGKGPNATGLKPPPANFTDAQFMRSETPYDFYHVISLGKTRSGMPAWDGALSAQERWDLVSYLWTLPPGSAGIAEGQGVYLAHCAGCHGATGTGQAAFSPVLLTAAPDISEPQSLARQTDAELFAAATDGIAATPMPSFARLLKDDERWKAVAFMRFLSLGGSRSADAATSNSLGGTVDANSADVALLESARLVEAAVVAYGRGDSQAAGIAGDGYLQFEPLEPGLGATDPALKGQVEEHFLHLRQQLRTPGRETEVRALAAAIHTDFTAVRAALQPHTSPYALFFESATIILREGFEIVLVIGALIAYVIKTGNQPMRRAIYAGTAVGVAMSLVTAFVMGELLRLHPGSSDVLEGCTMLLAAVVLFWVSYWLISKTEADKWQRYIRGKVQTALTGRRYMALAGAAFLAVYREGFETVLFYQALYASAPGAAMTVSAGFVVGAIVLAIVYLLFRRFQVRIPIQQFFFVTGLFLYAMAAIFAGQGVHELQEAGLIGLTLLSGIPTVPLLGIYPSVQSLLVQAVFVALFGYATLVTVRRRRAAGGGSVDDPVAELRALREAVEAVRGELAALRQRDPSALSSLLGDRVEDVLVRAEEVAGRIHVTAPINGRANGGRRNGH